MPGGGRGGQGGPHLLGSPLRGFATLIFSSEELSPVLAPPQLFPFLPTRTKSFGFPYPTKEKEQSKGFWGGQGEISMMGRGSMTPPHPSSNTIAPTAPFLYVAHLGNLLLPPRASVSPPAQRSVTEGTPPNPTTGTSSPPPPNRAVLMADSRCGCHRPPIRMPFGRGAFCRGRAGPGSDCAFPLKRG